MIICWTVPEIFYSFTPLTAQKTGPLFYTSVPKIMIICYTVHEIWALTDVIVIFHFGLFFAFIPWNSPKNQISQKWKKHLEISSFYTHVPKIMIRWCIVPEIWCTIDRQTDGQTKVTHRGGCPSPLTNHNHMRYNSWNIEWNRQNFLSFLGQFLAILPT